MVHIEEDVAVYDIKEGELVRYLTRPISYYWMKFFDEIPWRIIQGFFGVIIFTVCLILFHKFLMFASSLEAIIYAVILTVFAYLVSFTFKMIVGMVAFWFTDYWGFQEILEVVIVVLAGFIMPITFFPHLLKTIALLTPFPYIIYYPITAFQGAMTNDMFVQAVMGQLIWLVILVVVYKIMWLKGVRKFTGVSQ